MQINTTITYLKQAALSCPNMDSTRVSSDPMRRVEWMNNPNTPSIVVFPLSASYIRDGSDTERLPVTGTAVKGGKRKSLFTGTNRFLITFFSKDLTNIEILQDKFLEYLFANRLFDTSGNEITYDKNIRLTYENLGVDRKFFVSSFEITFTANLYNDRQLQPFNIQIEYEVFGGNVNE